ncbi:STAS domain-containing protein [Mycobacterium fragae]|jgi:anti-anti-sigma factor|uniref:STAS domain-containing protein n=1 Tax=Mycobacterium fragae TaxID=1260918 RepID=UPI000A156C40|nr:STAS domain-containing protein [Mycobacterium fragae]MCV7401945.1 STAS domain-containing protein [Mycobacterium fragae]
MISTINERSRTDASERLPARDCRVATDYSSMSLRTHFQPGATIIQACGAVDAGNAARLSDYVDDVANPGRPLILDLRGVDFVSGDGFRALVRIAEKAQRTGVRWVLVPSEAVDRLLHITDSNYRLPIAASVEGALLRLTSSDTAWSLPPRVTPPEESRC